MSTNAVIPLELYKCKNCGNIVYRKESGSFTHYDPLDINEDGTPREGLTYCANVGKKRDGWVYYGHECVADMSQPVNPSAILKPVTVPDIEPKPFPDSTPYSGRTCKHCHRPVEVNELDVDDIHFTHIRNHGHPMRKCRNAPEGSVYDESFTNEVAEPEESMPTCKNCGKPILKKEPSQGWESWDKKNQAHNKGYMHANGYVLCRHSGPGTNPKFHKEVAEPGEFTAEIHDPVPVPVPEIPHVPTPSEVFVLSKHPNAKRREDTRGEYIIDESTGQALSPFCTGPNPAWRWAEIHIKHFEAVPEVPA